MKSLIGKDAKWRLAEKARDKNGVVTYTSRAAIYTHQLLEIKLGIIGFLLLSLLLNDRLELILILLSS